MYRLLPSLGLVEFFVFMAVVGNRIVTGIGMVARIIFLYAFSRWNSERRKSAPPLGSNCRKIVFRGLRAYGATLYTFNLPST